MKKFQLLVSVIFFLQVVSCSNRVIYQSIERDLLYKMVYMTFLLSLDIEVKNSKKHFFLHFYFRAFFSILAKYLGQKSIAKKYFTSFCSPFNSARIHI